jgi:hypothetical protein
MFLSSCFGESDPAAGDPLYKTVPIIAKCEEGMYLGELSEIEQQKVLVYINSVRTTHKLPVVEYDNSDNSNKDVQKIAMYGAANSTASGPIVAEELCYPDISVNLNAVNRSLWGSATSKYPSSEIHVNDWLTELNSDNINNRRRLLDPFLKSVAFGRVIGTPKKGEYKYVSSAALLTKSENADLSESASTISYIAYPIDNYSDKLFDPNSFLSFSVLYDKRIKSSNGSSSIDLSNAKIEVSAGTQQLEIVEQSHDYNPTGLPNNLQWKVVGLTKNVPYTVKISGVKVADEDKTYTYTFSFK